MRNSLRRWRIVWVPVVGGIDKRAAFTALLDQSGPGQMRQMKGQRGIGNAERGGECAGGHAVFARLHQQPEQSEPMFLGQGAERTDSVNRSHPLIS
jgi:hypothetical protein